MEGLRELCIRPSTAAVAELSSPLLMVEAARQQSCLSAELHLLQDAPLPIPQDAAEHRLMQVYTRMEKLYDGLGAEQGVIEVRCGVEGHGIGSGADKRYGVSESRLIKTS